MQQVFFPENDEPTMLDVMSDPIIQLLMDYDGVSVGDIEAFMRTSLQRDPQLILG
jgi:hypothetical protein